VECGVGRPIDPVDAIDDLVKRHKPTLFNVHVFVELILLFESSIITSNSPFVNSIWLVSLKSS